MNLEEFTLNVLLLILCYSYIFSVIIISVKKTKLSKHSRKFLHIMIGNLIFFIPFFTLNSLPFNFPFFVAFPFVLLTLLVSPYSPIKLFDKIIQGLGGITEKGHNLGLLYYAISYSGAALFFASKPIVMATGILPMAFGDAASAIIGEKYGRHKYTIFSKKSVEGSLAMFMVSFFVLEISLFLLSVDSINFRLITILASSIALIVTLAEAISPKGLDNLTVPFSGILCFLVLTGGFAV